MGNAPKGAMSSPFSGFESQMKASGYFGTCGTESIKPFTDEELDVLLPQLAKASRPITKHDDNMFFVIEVNGIMLKVFKMI